jgi:DNA polymerase III epsilon subunit-like protein
MAKEKLSAVDQLRAEFERLEFIADKGRMIPENYAILCAFDGESGMFIIALDVETGGFDKPSALLQIGATAGMCSATGGQYYEIGSILIDVKPFEGATISEEALRVQGTTLELLEDRTDAIDEAEAFREFSTWLRTFQELTQNQVTMVGHTFSFDVKMIKWWLERIDKRMPMFITPYFDIHMMQTGLQLSGKVPMATSGKLEDMAKYWGVEPEGAYHNARTDCLLTAQLFAEMQPVILDERLGDHPSVITRRITYYGG